MRGWPTKIDQHAPITYPDHVDKVGFAIFEDSKQGEAALRAFLATPAVQKRTIADEMTKFAPANDGNDPKAYAEAIGKALNVDPGLAMSKLTPEQLDKFVEIVKQREGFNDPNGKSEIIK
jgi:hypothetical protein